MLCLNIQVQQFLAGKSLLNGDTFSDLDASSVFQVFEDMYTWYITEIFSACNVVDLNSELSGFREALMIAHTPTKAVPKHAGDSDAAGEDHVDDENTVPPNVASLHSFVYMLMA
eukprot:gene6576-6320_t